MTMLLVKAVRVTVLSKSTQVKHGTHMTVISDFLMVSPFIFLEAGRNYYK